MQNFNYLFEENKRILFGSYPTLNDNPQDNFRNSISKLVQEYNVDVFINLTEQKENFKPYNNILHYKPNIIINYPIKDNNVPTDIKTFKELINLIEFLYLNEHTIYIHCWGGHGRSGLLCACLLIAKFNYSSDYALKHVSKMHKTRLFNKDIPCPQTQIQIEFIKTFHFYY